MLHHFLDVRGAMCSVIAALSLIHNATNQSVAILGNDKHTNLLLCLANSWNPVSSLPFWRAFLCKRYSGCSIATSSKNFKYLALASRQTAWKDERDAHERLPAAMWLLESESMNHSESGENTTKRSLIQNTAQCFQGLFHRLFRSLARAIVANYHQVSNGKKWSDAFRVHTSEDARQRGSSCK